MRYELFLLANDVQGDDRKKATFLTLAGANLFDLLTSLASPKQVSALSLSEIKEILTNHFSPRPSEIASFYKFHKRDQQPDESFADYLAALRKLAVDCNFGSVLDRMLRDRVVCGLRDESLQRSLLAESDLQLQKVIDRATTAESASKNVMEIRHPEQVHSITRHKNDKYFSKKNYAHNNAVPQNCMGCGGNHQRTHCPHHNKVCQNCKKKGHLQRVCRSSASPSAATAIQRSKQAHQGRKNKQTFQSINQILPSVNMKKTVTTLINGNPCIFEIDSGSNYTLMSSRSFRGIWPDAEPPLYKCDLQLMDFQKNQIPVLGVADISLHYNNKQINNLPLVVVDGNQTDVVGWNWFPSLGIRIEGVHTVTNSLTVKGVLGKYQSLFSSELGCYKGPPITLPIDQTVAPVRCTPRRIPLATRSLVEDEIRRLCSQGILEPVEYSDWATPIVPVQKSDGSIRICGDYKSTVNKAIKPHCFQIPAISTLLSSIEGGHIFAKVDLAQAYQQLPVDDASSLLQTIVTHKGAFKVKRLQFGISSAPGIFQNLIENLLRGLDGVL